MAIPLGQYEHFNQVGHSKKPRFLVVLDINCFHESIAFPEKTCFPHLNFLVFNIINKGAKCRVQVHFAYNQSLILLLLSIITYQTLCVATL